MFEILDCEKTIDAIKYEEFEIKNISQELKEVLNALPTVTFTTISRSHFTPLLNSPISSSNVAVLLFQEYREKLNCLVDVEKKQIDGYIQEILDSVELQPYISSVGKDLNSSDCKRAFEGEIEWKDVKTDVVVYVKDLEQANRIDLNGKLPKRNDISVKIAEIPVVEEC